MAENFYSKQTTKANLKLAPTKTTDLRLSGVAAPKEMQPGKYLVEGESAWMERLGKGHRCTIQYRVVDGKYGGVALRQWMTAADGGGSISPTGRYARQCAIALGRELHQDDPVGDPAQVFVGGRFVAFVGYRKTEHAKGGQSSDDRALRCKDEKDYLRVHEVVSRVDV